MRSRPSTNLQTTLAAAVTLEGVGAHSGRPARIVLSPGDAGSGVVFSRGGRASAVDASIAALARNVSSTDLSVRIGAGEGSVATIEHLMAALNGLGVDNAVVDIDGPEVPAMDGSAAAFVAAIDEAGVVPLPAPRRAILLRAPVRVCDGAAWAELAPAPAGGFHMDVEISFPGAPIGRMRRRLSLTPARFRAELARARTFGFLGDAERLWRSGLALGASLDNTVVIAEERILNPEGLRFADEFVRHKMLDVLGDLALAGAPIIGAFRSYRGGHRLNLALLETLLATPGAYEIVGAAEQSARPTARVGAGR
ncbi:UDP-3-O-acyl-N-acetylglucosamine deacetylase [Methylosinus sp. Sm6]|uniref:UDP-3-O-acyl-N-acetylglucosamine deacetylase n=1 Tax=Methylosinus sp. Sm6 TaxID=2866948 RepID=UPI001C9A11D6|nr:UDP-3-O-acyl-N-acetylglucosamine deacetylase [Methylosinus sp. Sm6]MBY6240748.1 UDP-3-O-acyl-N-acetylglucosamine deacetylase [Methylosinus sp. Sm6]